MGTIATNRAVAKTRKGAGVFIRGWMLSNPLATAESKAATRWRYRPSLSGRGSGLPAPPPESKSSRAPRVNTDIIYALCTARRGNSALALGLSQTRVVSRGAKLSLVILVSPQPWHSQGSVRADVGERDRDYVFPRRGQSNRPAAPRPNKASVVGSGMTSTTMSTSPSRAPLAPVPAATAYN